MASAEVYGLLRRMHEVLAARHFIIRYFDYAPDVDPPNYYRASDTFRSSIDDLGAILDREITAWSRLGHVQVFIVAHSLGGLIAAHWASRLDAHQDLAHRLFVTTVASPLHMPLRDLLNYEGGDQIAALLAGYDIHNLTTRIRLGCLCAQEDEWVPVDYASYPPDGQEHPARQRVFTLPPAAKASDTDQFHNCICLHQEVLEELGSWIDGELPG